MSEEEEEESLPDDIEDDRLLFNLEDDDEEELSSLSTSWMNSLEQVDSMGSSKSVRRRDDVDPEVASSNNL